MSRLSLLADVNISPATVAALNTNGYNTIRTTEVLPATIADVEILEFARRDERVVVTQDLDFSMLMALSNDTESVKHRER
ncbi:MAG: DUF5615 family PIN-like protein [Cyanobacteria bacterium P01_G01_bin.54]